VPFLRSNHHEQRIYKYIKHKRIRDFCRDLFKSLKILPFQSQYIFSLLCFVVKNMDQYKINWIFMVRILDKVPFFIKLLLTCHFMGIKIFNCLPSDIKDLSHNIKQFKLVLKNFLYLNSFYTLDGYFNCNNV
jgi:hypothetical protein